MLEAANLFHANLSKANLSHANIFSADLQQAKLRRYSPEAIRKFQQTTTCIME
jgi:uncharacterized protein YjbI with pentapeptide repeats